MSDVQQKNDAAVRGAEEAAAPAKRITRRDVLTMCGCGVAGLIVGGVVAKWGATEKAIAAGRIEISTTPQKFIVTDRGRCSGCQRCEMMCSLRNDGWVSQQTARVRVWESYNFGASPDTLDGIYDNCQFTIRSCKQCSDPACVDNCPVHAISADPETGARVVNEDVCIGCGMCHEACPWNMPQVSSETGKSTKCISCGRCAEQCPNGAIKFIDWQDIYQECIEAGIINTADIAGALVRP